MTCGIYKITENETGRCYIGQSKNVEKRWKKHHKRFPTSDFSYEIVIRCIDEPEILDYWERFCIADFKGKMLGFNRTKGGNGAWGWKNPEETRRKLIESHKGQIPWIKGRTQSEESKAKISKNNKGKTRSEEAKANYREAWKRRKEK